MTCVLCTLIEEVYGSKMMASNNKPKQGAIILIAYKLSSTIMVTHAACQWVVGRAGGKAQRREGDCRAEQRGASMGADDSNLTMTSTTPT